MHSGTGPLRLEIVSSSGHVSFGLHCRPEARSYVESQLAAQYPGVQLQAANDGEDAGTATASVA